MDTGDSIHRGFLRSGDCTLPSRPARPCSHSGCSAITHARWCPRHAAEYADTERARQARRPSAAARGYGAAWQRARAEHLAIEPLCRQCGSVAREVHHLHPIDQGGTHDHANLASLCVNCHHRVTKRAADARRMVTA